MTTDVQATVSDPLLLPTAGAGTPASRSAADAGRSTGRATGARALDEAWERLGDGVFTYCLSVLCDQAEAVAVVREARQLSVRHRRRLRRPELLRAWLYALARHVCLVRMETADPSAPPPRPVGRHTAEHGRLATLGWPEAAGVTPAQREALELAGRHGLRPAELGAVLDLTTEQAGTLLAQAVCELERTAAALAVLAAGSCPELARLGEGRGPVLGTALRGELVRHVDACPTCRGTAERAAAAGPWPGTLRAPVSPALVRAPAEAREAAAGEGFFASLAAGRGEEAREPRFDRRGFPVHRTARSERATMLRQRAVASSVIAMVVAAPVIALWVSHQSPAPAEDPVSSVRVDSVAPIPDPAPEPSGSAASGLLPAAPSPYAAQAPVPPLTAEGRHGAGLGFTAVPSAPAAAPARLVVSAGELGGRTVITLVNSGGTAVAWQADTAARWLRLSRSGGTLGPGQRATLLVTVDRAALPRGPWSARVAIAPSGSVVVLRGRGTGQGSGGGSGSGGGRRGAPPPTASPTPSSTPTTAPTGTPTSTADPSPSTTASDPSTPSGSASAAPSDSATAAPQGRHR